ncbi:MAG: SIMPL domain-containing protein [Prolixibacteraceae bacterium]|nr:SIMPL domain-containing protein [Prolixibacteraceae bacterium]
MKNSWALILGISIIISFGLLGWFFRQSRQVQQTVRVVGYGTEEFDSNIVKWSVSFSERVPLNGTQEGYKMMAKKLEDFKKLWEETGIRSSEFKVFPVNVNREYGQNGHIGYTLDQRIYIVSDEIEKVNQLAIDPMLFVNSGVTFDTSVMEFYSTEIEEIKKQLLGKATQNAFERAEEIISVTDLKVDKLISARAGVFQITEPYSTEVSGYGIHNTSSSKKNIKVTVSAEFTLK